MEHITSCYYQQEAVPALFLVLQQRRYRRRGFHVVIACIADNREQLRDLWDKMEEELDGADIRNAERGEYIREKWSAYLEKQPKDSNCAGVLCVEDRLLLFSRGKMNICGFFRRFGKPAWKVWREQCMVGEVEAGTAILLADHAFLNLCDEELAECLRPGEVGTDPETPEAGERAERRLKELGHKAEELGGRHMGAIWILPVEGGRERVWRRH